jgi:acyl-CoA synthetase (AMP-forming)/AMP-acid ligase II
MTLLASFLDYARRSPQQPALVFAKNTINYGALGDEACALAKAYQKAGICSGDHVLLGLPIGIDLYRAMLALWWCGAVVALPDASASMDSLQAGLSQIPLKAMITNWKGKFLRLLLPATRNVPKLLPFFSGADVSSLAPPPLSGDQPMLITFTSGSTGRPKGILRSQAFLQGQLNSIRRLLDLREGETDIISLPVFALANLVSGVTSVFPDGPLARPAAIKAGPLMRQIERWRPARLVIPPTIAEKLSREKFEWPANLKFFTGGGPVYPDLLQRLLRFVPAENLIAVYGSTEAEPIAVMKASEITPVDWQDMQKGRGILAGNIQADMQLAIREEEITVTGPEVIKGYINPVDDSQTKLHLDGAIWHKTGDAGRLDEKGRLWLLGRVAAGGKGIYPFQIEAAARLLRGVEQAAFVAIHDKPFLAYMADEEIKDVQALKNICPDLVLVRLRALPFDRRHNSKIDYTRLKTMLAHA